MGGCCGEATLALPGGWRSTSSGLFDHVSFPTKPLWIVVTPDAENINAYITSVLKNCPAKEEIVLNSKIVKVNGTSTDGWESTKIAELMKTSELPLRMTLARPCTLAENDVPHRTPELINMQK